MVHLEGCSPPLLQWLRSNIWAAGGYAIVVVVVQGAELLLAIQLVRALAVHKRAAESEGLSTGPPDSVPSPLPNWSGADWQVRPKTRAPGWGLGLQASPPLPGKVSE